MRMVRFTVKLLIFLLVIGLPGPAIAKDNVGTLVAIRGKAIIERDKKDIDAKIRDSIFLEDAVSTLEASRVKMLFIDDSVLTLGEKSKAVIREFIYSKEKGGKSIFNLIDGKMRAIVGKTSFEVHTPTAVAAARGTIILFWTGVVDGKAFTTIICLEREVNITSADPSITGSIKLLPGMMVTIFAGEPLHTPTPAPISEIERLQRETDISVHEIQIPGPAGIVIGPDLVPSILPPPIMQQPTITPPTPPSPPPTPPSPPPTPPSPPPTPPSPPPTPPPTPPPEQPYSPILPPESPPGY